MNIGVIIKYFKLRRYGFIKTYDKIYFFHFDKIKSPVYKNDLVVFNIKKTNEKEQAIDIENINKHSEVLKNAYDDEKYKWIIIKNNENIYKEKYNKFINEHEIQNFLNKQSNYINAYVDQFSSRKFFEKYTVNFERKFVKIGGNDWTKLLIKYSLTSNYKIKYDFNLDFSPFDLNNTINGIIEDNYINNFINFYQHLESIDYSKDKELTMKNFDYNEYDLNKIKKDIVDNFSSNYSEKTHLESLDKYLHKLEFGRDRRFKSKFMDIVNEKVELFLRNNLPDESWLISSNKELFEDLEAEGFL